MSKSELLLNTPIMNAAGCLGFAPDTHGPTDLSQLGAFITNPISLLARSPAHGPRFLSFPGGFMLHTGYPNPGLGAPPGATPHAGGAHPCLCWFTSWRRRSET